MKPNQLKIKTEDRIQKQAIKDKIRSVIGHLIKKQKIMYKAHK